jgi:hypothetical protein
LRHQQARTYVLRAGDVVIVFDPEELGARPERKS